MFGNLSKEDWQTVFKVFEKNIEIDEPEKVVWTVLRDYAVANGELRWAMDSNLKADAFGPVRVEAAFHRDDALDDESGGPLADFWNDVAIFCDDAINTRRSKGG